MPLTIRNVSAAYSLQMRQQVKVRRQPFQDRVQLHRRNRRVPVYQ